MNHEDTRRYCAKQGARSKQSGYGLLAPSNEIPVRESDEEASLPDGKLIAFASKGVVIRKALVRKAD